MGISVKRVFALSWSFAAITAGIGGIIIGNISGISIHLGHIGLKVLVRDHTRRTGQHSGSHRGWLYHRHP